MAAMDLFLLSSVNLEEEMSLKPGLDPLANVDPRSMQRLCNPVTH